VKYVAVIEISANLSKIIDAENGDEAMTKAREYIRENYGVAWDRASVEIKKPDFAELMTAVFNASWSAINAKEPEKAGGAE
jgi:hypothetical protein